MATTLPAQTAPHRPILPEEFHFSQSTLQVYEDCPRRFWLSHIARLPWPAVEVAPAVVHEQQMVWGDEFHRLVQRAEIGLNPAPPTTAPGLPLAEWFNAYLEHRPTDLPSAYLEVELSLSTPFTLNDRVTSTGAPETVRLVAKFDLLAVNPGGPAVIIDWKTGKQRGDPNRLLRRLQTAIYCYVLVETSPSMPWGTLTPEQVEMRYWFTADPLQTVRLPYSAHQHTANRVRLQRLIRAILDGHTAADFPQISDTDHNRRYVCGFCPYRSRCNRGVGAQSAADLPEFDAEFDDAAPSLDFALADIEELAF